MPHPFRVGQLVALAQMSRDPETYEVMQLMPETPSGEPQYGSRDCQAASFAPCAGRDQAAPLRATPQLRLGVGQRELRPAAWDQLKPDTNVHSSPKPTRRANQPEFV